MPIFRGKIRAGRNSVRPDAYKTWDFASRKLEEARLSIRKMEEAGDRSTYTEAWGRFVDSLQEAWVSFNYEGKKTVPGFKQWITPIYMERTEDPLLDYLYQARNQSQHGIVPLNWTDPHLKIAPNTSFSFKKLEIAKDFSYVFDAEPLDGKSELALEHSPSDPELPTIHNRRSKQSFEPPTQHLGHTLPSRDPVAAARLALVYYDALLGKARDELIGKKI